MTSEQSAVLSRPRQESRNGAAAKRMDNFHFSDYDLGGFHDEMFDPGGTARPDCEPLFRRMQTMTADDLARRQKAADRSMVQLGITFNVYGDTRPAADKSALRHRAADHRQSANGSGIERGLKQRITALNLFLEDVYHEQKIVRDGVVPEWLSSPRRPASANSASVSRRRAASGVTSPAPTWCATATARYYVLEDNLRCPSGVSYVLENRQLMKRRFPELFEQTSIRPVDDYRAGSWTRCSTSREDQVGPRPSGAVVAWQLQLGLFRALVPGPADGHRTGGRPRPGGARRLVYMRTTKGFERMDVIYRRIDDDFLDPEAFRADSCWACRASWTSIARGRIALANAPGTGIADDKVVVRLRAAR